MTIAELIAELQKHPGHYLALIEVYSTNPDNGCVDEELIFIRDVQLQTNVGDLGCAVKIVSDSML